MYFYNIWNWQYGEIFRFIVMNSSTYKIYIYIGDKKGLKKKEDFWINQLRTYKANGGNCMNIRKEW